MVPSMAEGIPWGCLPDAMYASSLLLQPDVDVDKKWIRTHIAAG